LLRCLLQFRFTAQIFVRAKSRRWFHLRPMRIIQPPFITASDICRKSPLSACSILIDSGFEFDNPRRKPGSVPRAIAELIALRGGGRLENGRIPF